jgi:Flp pilus assembly protein TadG
MAFALTALIGMAAMGISVGIWRYEQQLAQTAADSGAVAAAVELKNSGTLAQMYAAANVDTTANGFKGSSSNGVLNSYRKVTVTVNNPPTSGTATTNANAVEVIVSKQLPVYFGWTTLTVSARAVATNPTPSGNCMVALSQLYDVITMDSQSQIIAPTCDVVSNGWLQLNSPKALDAKKISYRIGITGSTTYAGGTPGTGNLTADPCSTIPGCKYLQTTDAAALHSADCTGESALYTTAPTHSVNLTPGTYCWGTFPAGTFNFAPGLYNFTIGFSEANAGVDLSGTGVTIYSGNSLTFGQGTVNLTAPTSGNTAGVVLFVTGAYSGINFNTNSDKVTLDGLLYVSMGGTNTGQIIFDGTNLTVGSIVCQSVTMNSNSIVTLTDSGSSAGGNGGLSE